MFLILVDVVDTCVNNINKNQEHASYSHSRTGEVVRSTTRYTLTLWKLSYSKFSVNMGWSETNFTYTVKFTDPENPLIGARIRTISHTEAQL